MMTSTHTRNIETYAVKADLEQWQLEHRSAQEYEHAGFELDEDVPMMLGDVEDEQVYRADGQYAVQPRHRYIGTPVTETPIDIAIGAIRQDTEYDSLDSE